MILIARGCINWVRIPLILFVIFLSVGILTKNLAFYGISVFCLILGIFLAVFFRDPDRIVPKNPKSLVSPADGTVIKTDTIGSMARIAIFMNRHDVHVNRSPIEGKVLEIKRIKGPKKLAYKDYSEKNNRLVTKFSTKIGEILVVQISGIFARRIQTYLEKGQYVEKGQRIGIIKFSSRCDVYLPRDKISVNIKNGDKVKAGETVIAFIK